METTKMVNGTQVHLALVTHVKNTASVRQQVLTGTFPLTIIDATKILDPFLVRVAVTNAVDQQLAGSLKTKNLSTEILANLSPFGNIGQSLQHFGIQDTTPNFLVVKVGGDAADANEEIAKLIDGNVVPLKELEHLVKFDEQKKFYKLKADNLSREATVNLVTTMLATRNL